MSDRQTVPTEHALFPWSPIVRRERMVWPGGRPLAMALVVNMEHYDPVPPDDAFAPPNVPGGFGRAPFPDVRAWSMREYGNQVGLARIARLVDRYGLPATLAVDALSAQRRPAQVAELASAGWDVVAHGLSVNRILSSRMSDEDERAAIDLSLEAASRSAGRAVIGWHGAEYGESTRTPRLLAERGIRYLLDWPNDEQPYWMDTGAGRLLSVPVQADLDDVVAHWHRKLSMDRWVRSVADAVDQLIVDGADRPRCLVLNLHAWLTGQPWRSTWLAELLALLAARRQEIWFTTCDRLAGHVIDGGDVA